MTKLTVEVKKYILRVHSSLSSPVIARELRNKFDIQVSSKAINNFLRNYKRIKTLVRLQGSGRPSKLTSGILEQLWKLWCKQMMRLQLYSYLNYLQGVECVLVLLQSSVVDWALSGLFMGLDTVRWFVKQTKKKDLMTFMMLYGPMKPLFNWRVIAGIVFASTMQNQGLNLVQNTP